MKVYHGSDTVVDIPKILNPSRPLDFGGGFYVTTNIEQAKRWAKRVAYRNMSAQECVNHYEFELEQAVMHSVLKRFDRADEKWFEFICGNRQGRVAENMILSWVPSRMIKFTA